MKIAIQELNIALKNFLRQCGYVEISNPHKNNETSYARSLDPGRFYPRFHIYIDPVRSSPPKGSFGPRLRAGAASNGIEKQTPDIILNLHLDAKKPSYEGTSAHSGEYNGAVVENESQRIKKISEKFISKSENLSIGFKTKTSWREKIISLFKK
jgi:hypothetical protein